MQSAKRFFGDATKYAKASNCSGAITSLMLGASYEGEAQAHAEASGDSNNMVRVRALFGIRDKAQAKVIQACARPPKKS